MADLLTDMKTSGASNYDVNVLISHCLNIGMDKRPKEQELIGRVLAQTFDNTRAILKPELVSQGVFEVLEYLEDYLVDIPLAIPYTISMLTPLVQVEALEFPALLANVEHLAHNGKAGTLVLGVLNELDNKASLLVKHEKELVQLFAPENRTIEYLNAQAA